MTSVQGTGQGPVRWGMLAVVSLGIMALTLNWVDVATAFPLIGTATGLMLAGYARC